jgi:hypothetical protein
MGDNLVAAEMAEMAEMGEMVEAERCLECGSSLGSLGSLGSLDHRERCLRQALDPGCHWTCLKKSEEVEAVEDRMAEWELHVVAMLEIELELENIESELENIEIELENVEVENVGGCLKP